GAEVHWVTVASWAAVGPAPFGQFLLLAADPPRDVVGLLGVDSGQDADAEQVIGAARVNLSEAGSLGNHCVVAVSSFGWLIQTAVGSAGGWGGLPTKRSGWAA